jgi:hypothetical protein
MEFAYRTYEDLNMFYGKGNWQVTGDELKGFLVTGTVGNAGWSDPWAEDSIAVRNITKEYSISPFKHCKGAMAFNRMEVSANSGPEKIFNVVKLQYKKARAELIDKIREGMWYGPSSAADVDSPYAITTWLLLGTQLSTGGYTGYQSRYNDGNTPGTAFDTAGLTSSAAVNPEWANWYADHQGNLDESLFRLINKMLMEQNFKPPVMLVDSNVPKVNYACFSTQNVILTLNQLYMRLNSQVGPQPMNNGYYSLSPTMIPGAIPLVWSDILDTNNVSLWGEDPIYGVNFEQLYPVYLKDWKFAVTEDNESNRHLVRDVFIDYAGQVWCDSPKNAGGLISNHPSNL